MARPYRAAVGALIWLLIAGCSSEAATYEECLVEIGKEQSIDDARSVCREAFPAAESFYVGEFYYPTTEGCAAISFDPAGRTEPLSSGFCGRGSAIDCGGSDSDCQLVCRNFNELDTTRIFHVLEVNDGLLLSGFISGNSGDVAEELARSFVDSVDPDPASVLFLYSRLSSCEAAALETR